MLVSTKGRYALRMMIDIAERCERGRVSLREIGERQDISAKYLEQLARSLCASGLLNGSRGQGGGYALSKSAAEISVGEILRSAEGTVAPVSCLAHPEMVCPRHDTCKTIEFWTGLDETIERYVDGWTLDDLVKGACIQALPIAEAEL